MKTGHNAALHLLPVVTLIIVSISGCGSDEGNAEEGVGTANNAGARPTKPLAANTAGAACATDKECGGGTCSKQLSGGAAALLGGGALDAPGGYCTSACSVSADCGKGGTCVSGQLGADLIGAFLGGGMRAGSAPSGTCYGSCEGPDSCREGYRCVSSAGQAVVGTETGTCQPTPPTDKLPDGIVGNSCAAAEDCTGGTCVTTDQLTMSTYPDGYCSGRCLSDEDCGSTGVCSLLIPGSTGTCYRMCELDSDCARKGYRCRADAAGGFLGGQAGAADDTPPSKRCVPGGAPLPDGIVGSACTDDEQCGAVAGSCRSQLAAPFGGTATALPGGYCSQTCVDDSDCGADGVCSGAFGGFVEGNCFKACAAGSECRDGYQCGAPPSLGLPGGGMFPGAGGMTGAETAQTVCSPLTVTNADNDAGTP